MTRSSGTPKPSAPTRARSSKSPTTSIRWSTWARPSGGRAARTVRSDTSSRPGGWRPRTPRRTTTWGRARPMPASPTKLPARAAPPRRSMPSTRWPGAAWLRSSSSAAAARARAPPFPSFSSWRPRARAARPTTRSRRASHGSRILAREQLDLGLVVGRQDLGPDGFLADVEVRKLLRELAPEVHARPLDAHETLPVGIIFERHVNARVCGARPLEIELEVIEVRGGAILPRDAARDLIADRSDAGQAVGVGGQLVAEEDEIVGTLLAAQV